jgi:hypothetical protein
MSAQCFKVALVAPHVTFFRRHVWNEQVSFGEHGMIQALV